MDNAISSAHKTKCKCCDQRKWCKLYILQNGEAEWVCKDCREGKKDGTPISN